MRSSTPVSRINLHTEAPSCTFGLRNFGFVNSGVVIDCSLSIPTGCHGSSDWTSLRTDASTPFHPTSLSHWFLSWLTALSGRKREQIIKVENSRSDLLRRPCRSSCQNTESIQRIPADALESSRFDTRHGALTTETSVQISQWRRLHKSQIHGIL